MSLKMADLYANAKFTIAADKADGLEHGFLVDSGKSTATPETRLLDYDKHDDNHNRAPISPLSLNKPLNSRAWALSEAIFSNRTLHLTSSAGLIWESNQVRRTQNPNNNNPKLNPTAATNHHHHQSIMDHNTHQTQHPGLLPHLPQHQPSQGIHNT